VNQPANLTGDFDGSPAAESKRYVLRLYVTGTTPRSLRAIASLKELCETHLQGRYELEIVDLYQKPELAAEGQVVAVPTLLNELPAPVRTFIGDLADTEKVLKRLDICPGG
jgi:circadian clock protein KaiB